MLDVRMALVIGRNTKTLSCETDWSLNDLFH